MKSVIAALRALQDVDHTRIDLEKERQAITDRVAELASILNEMERELAEKHDKLKEAERWYKEKERELKDDNEKIKRAQTRLNALTKAKEYAAVQREIELLRRSNAIKEEEILKLLGVIDEFRAAVDEDGKKFQDLRGELETEKLTTTERVAELDRRLAELGLEHGQYEKDIPTEYLRRYHRIQSAWQGMAVVPVNGKGSCGGCHRALPPQLYNILLRQQTLESCPYCNRFVYVPCEPENGAHAG